MDYGWPFGLKGISELLSFAMSMKTEHLDFSLGVYARFPEPLSVLYSLTKSEFWKLCRPVWGKQGMFRSSAALASLIDIKDKGNDLLHSFYSGSYG